MSDIKSTTQKSGYVIAFVSAALILAMLFWMSWPLIFGWAFNWAFSTRWYGWDCDSVSEITDEGVKEVSDIIQTGGVGECVLATQAFRVTIGAFGYERSPVVPTIRFVFERLNDEPVTIDISGLKVLGQEGFVYSLKKQWTSQDPTPPVLESLILSLQERKIEYTAFFLTGRAKPEPTTPWRVSLPIEIGNSSHRYTIKFRERSFLRGPRFMM